MLETRLDRSHLRTKGVQLQKTLDPNQITGWGMCDEHEALKRRGFVALVACDPARSGRPKANGNFDPSEVYRTGEIAHLRDRAWEEIMNVPVPKDMVCFCESEVVNYLKEVQEAAS